MRSNHLRTRLGATLIAGAIAGLGLVVPISGAGATRAVPAGVTGKATHLTGKDCAANRAVGPVTFVSPFGFGSGPALLEIFVAKQLGFFADECLNVNIVTSSYVPNELVSADTAQFTSEGSAADTIEAIAAGSNMVGVATFADSSSYVLLTQSKFKTLKSLDGGTLGYHTAMPVVLTEMLKKAGVHGVQLINDSSYDPTLLTQGKFDALQAYTVNEPLTLRGQHLKFNEFFPSSYGVEGTFNVVVANAKFAKQHPIATTDFLRAEMHGIDYCVAHTLVCVNMEAADAQAAGSFYQVEHSFQEWNASMRIVNKYGLPGTGIGVETTAEWMPELKALKTYGVLSSIPSLSSMEKPSFIASIYNGTKLIWPGP